MKYEHYTRPSVNDIFAGKQSKYALAIAVAKRARQITDDMQDDTGKVYDKPVLVAVDEFARNEYAILEPDVNE